MRLPSHAAPLLCLALAVPLPAAAAWGQIDSFGASATSVSAGTLVDFTVSFSVLTSASSYGGSNPFEPAPQEGYQNWDINWYGYENETLNQVWLEAAGSSFSDFPSLSPGSSHAGSWSFSVLFPTAGSFELTLAGGWASQVEVYSSSESASRDCWNIDPEGSNELACSSWSYHYADYSDTYSSSGAFAGHSLVIEVLAAPVPEPHTLALWLAGLGGLGAAIRRRA